MTKTAFLKIEDCWRPPFWKSLNRHISVENCPISMKFGTLMVNSIAVTWPKIEIFEIHDGGDRHLENRFFGHNSRPISAKFCVRKQNGMPTKATWQKLQIFKIQDGGQSQYLWPYRLYYITQPYKNLGIANRSRVSCAHNMSRGFIGLSITPWPWNQRKGSLKVSGNGTIGQIIHDLLLVELFDVKYYRDLEMWVRGHSRSLKVVPFGREAWVWFSIRLL